MWVSFTVFYKGKWKLKKRVAYNQIGIKYLKKKHFDEKKKIGGKTAWLEKKKHQTGFFTKGKNKMLGTETFQKKKETKQEKKSVST